MKHPGYFAAFFLFTLLSCGERKPSGSAATAADAVKVLRSETMDGRTFRIADNDTFSAEPKIKGGQTEKCFGYHPVDMSGKPIYSTSDEGVQPELTADGRKTAADVAAFFAKRFPQEYKEDVKVAINDFVIDETGKVVHYACQAVLLDTSKVSMDRLQAFFAKVRPVADSLQPVLLSITFRPAHSGGKAVPYYIPDIEELK